MDGRMDGWTDRQTNRWTERQTDMEIPPCGLQNIGPLRLLPKKSDYGSVRTDFGLERLV